MSPPPSPALPADRPPSSCVGWWDAFIGLGVIFTLFFSLRHVSSLSDSMLALIMILGTGATLGIIEILRAPWRHSRPSSEAFETILWRAGVKYLGFLGGFGFILFLYWLFPEYRRPFYEPYFHILWQAVPFILFLFIPYFIFAEWRFPDTRDGSWQMGQLLRGRWRDIDWPTLQQNILGWLVKGFFLPNMLGDLIKGLPHFRYANWNLWELDFDALFSLLYHATVNLVLVFVVAGYALGCRLFNSHIRAVDNTMLGWSVALVAYGPFISLSFTRYFAYRIEGINWQDWLAGHPYLLAAWGSVILLLLFIHLWCDACFGVRFSNLTHRGIITNGCYRFSKHPAYFIKSLRWWMMWVPFAATGSFIENTRLSLILVGVCLVYMVRCYAEEKLLSRDPVYQAYGLWMDRHSWFAWAGRLIPILRYEYRLKKWKEQGIVKPLPVQETSS